MASLNPYLNFPGNTEEAFRFYESAFGSKIEMITRFKDNPETAKVPENEQNMVMHVALPIGKGNMIMGTDAVESMGQKVVPGNNIHISISADSLEEAERVFAALSKGGQVTMPLQKQFWGDMFGMITDKFGVQWMMSYREAK